MTEEQKLPRRSPPQERITLDKDALSKLTSWNEQLSLHLKCVKVSRSDLVNWCINEFSEKISHENRKRLEAKFFDPVRALEWAAKQARLVKEQGQDFNLESFLRQSLPLPSRERKISAKRSEPKPNLLEENPL